MIWRNCRELLHSALALIVPLREAGFWFMAGSNRTVIGGMGGPGAPSSKPLNVCEVALGYFVSGRGKETLTLFANKTDCSPKAWWPLISVFAVKVDFSNTIFV